MSPSMEPATNATANGTSSNANNPPTGVSENYPEKNAPAYDGIGVKGPSHSGAENNASGDNDAGTAPLLPTYSFAVAQPPPRRSTWRRMTGGPTSNTNSKNAADVVKHPRVRAIYSNKGWCLIPQVVFSFFVIGATARSLSISERMPSVIPMLGYILACAAINLIPMLFFACETKPLSPRTPRLATWYLVGYGISSLTWIGAIVCVILVLIKSMPYEGDGGCGRHHKCYPSQYNAHINDLAKMNMATGSFIILSIISHWYNISKLWLCDFTEDEIRAAYEYVPKTSSNNN